MAKSLEKRLEDQEKKMQPRDCLLSILYPAIGDWYDVELIKLDPEARLTAYQKILDDKYSKVWDRIRPHIEKQLTLWANPVLVQSPHHKKMTKKEIEAWEKRQQLKRRLVYLWRRYGVTTLTKKDRARFQPGMRLDVSVAKQKGKHD